MKANLEQQQNPRPLIVAGLFLGLGQGGFFDGIVFHQILQWHHMFSNIESSKTIIGLEINTLGDGLFHVLDWLFTIIGIICLWRAGNREDVPWSTGILLGSVMMGAGLFNVVEGILDHHIFNLHHVKPGTHQLAWDIGFIAVGVLFILLGWWVIQKFSHLETTSK
ncbi:conserved hypothetical protein [Gloeothece citriformis PCC 7424]|uniref:DUF2243 domain-containing protein n=1 Tax=Gloeothece citriformis (strain PCC 7424) TaxID=65393 RepID=B7K7M5_GLOC7|nr:DUF2243 domain-containing protein [Gloeothece citriformis]ACK69793.1 conserved hypothetical protein [Gloeothece citriformis PCC 7424]